MSRIGNKPIEIPSNVEVTVDDQNVVTAKGPKGEVFTAVDPKLMINIEDGTLVIERPSDKKEDKAAHGLARTLVSNLVEGVVEGYSKELEIVGTGYRAEKNGKTLNLNLGYSHPIDLEDPEGIEVEVPSNTKIIVRGADKQKVGAYAAYIRSLRQPEPYKGKGIRYVDEYVRRKVGKTGK